MVEPSRICLFHKKHFTECPDNCGYAYLIVDRIQTALVREKRAAAKERAGKRRGISRSPKKKREKVQEGAPRFCIQCGVAVSTKWNPLYCSVACGIKYRDSHRPPEKKYPRHCVQCGTEVPDKWKPKYCSEACGYAHRKSLLPPPKVRELKVLYCGYCRQALPRVEGKNYFASALYCSAHCREEKWKQRRKPPPPKVVLEDRACAECGKSFTPVSRMGKMCSAKCGQRYHSKLQDARHKEKKRLERCFFWPEKRSCPECGKEVLTTFESRDKKYCSRKCSKRRQGRMTDQRRLLRDPTFKVMRRLSSRIRESLRRKHVLKTTTSIKYLGCTAGHLRTHLESQFAEGMSWDNYGVFGWHVDHIIPCAAFDLSREDHQMVCFNYRNLRPLWHHENNEKGDTVDMDVLLAADLWVVQEARRLGVRV